MDEDGGDYDDDFSNYDENDGQNAGKTEERGEKTDRYAQ